MISATLAGAGAWGPGFSSIDELNALAASGAHVDPDAGEIPKPARIPKRELRRSPALVRLAVEVAGQACDAAGIDPQHPHCVFTSAMSDTVLTDYMCRALATDDKLLSPTKFHNSVHNAAAGYWSISTRCESPATFVSGFEHCFPVALMEAMVQVASTNAPVLLVATDIPTELPMRDALAIDSLFGSALLLAPGERAGGPRIDVSVAQGARPWPAADVENLKALYDTNPSARALSVLLAAHRETPTRLDLPMNEHSHCQVHVYAAA